MKRPEVTIAKYKKDGKWIISVRGISSGFTVTPMDVDNILIQCQFDATRFNPTIQTKHE